MVWISGKTWDEDYQTSISWMPVWHGYADMDSCELLWMIETGRRGNDLKVCLEWWIWKKKTCYWSEACISFWRKNTPSIMHGDHGDHHLLTFTNKKKHNFLRRWSKKLVMFEHVESLTFYIASVRLWKLQLTIFTKFVSSNFGGVTLILIRHLLHVCACLFWGTQFFAERSKGSYIAIAMGTGDETRHAETELWKSDIHSELRGGFFTNNFD